MEQNLQAFLGSPIRFKNICTIYPPLVNDVVNSPDFYSSLSLLTLSQEDIWDLMNDALLAQSPNHEWERPDGAPTPFAYLMLMANKDDKGYASVEKAIKVFTKTNVVIAPQLSRIYFFEDDIDGIDINDLPYLSEETYLDFQNLIRSAMGREPKIAPNPEESKRLSAFKAKSRYRDKIKNKKSGVSLMSILSSVCCMGIGITPHNIGTLSYASLSHLMTFYRRKSKYEGDRQMIIAGADPKLVKPLDDWMADPEDK